MNWSRNRKLSWSSRNRKKRGRMSTIDGIHSKSEFFLWKKASFYGAWDTHRGLWCAPPLNDVLAAISSFLSRELRIFLVLFFTAPTGECQACESRCLIISLLTATYFGDESRSVVCRLASPLLTRAAPKNEGCRCIVLTYSAIQRRSHIFIFRSLKNQQSWFPFARSDADTLDTDCHAAERPQCCMLPILRQRGL